jgi:hypothetical protein
MRSSLLARRVASLAAAAALATTGAMAVGGAAGASTVHVKRHPTHMSIADKRVTRHHKHVTVIGGRLTSGKTGLGGKLVFLDRVTGHKLALAGRERTSRGGFVVFVADPKKATHFVLVFPGTPRFHSSHSRVITVKD